MNNPDAKTAANTPAPGAPVIAVEKLIDSMKPEKPLVIDSGSSFGGGGSVGGGTAITSVPGGSTSPTEP